jgi:hypothetical protein
VRGEGDGGASRHGAGGERLEEGRRLEADERVQLAVDRPCVEVSNSGAYRRRAAPRVERGHGVHFGRGCAAASASCHHHQGLNIAKISMGRLSCNLHAPPSNAVPRQQFPRRMNHLSHKPHTKSMKCSFAYFSDVILFFSVSAIDFVFCSAQQSIGVVSNTGSLHMKLESFFRYVDLHEGILRLLWASGYDCLVLTCTLGGVSGGERGPGRGPLEEYVAWNGLPFVGGDRKNKSREGKP